MSGTRSLVLAVALTAVCGIQAAEAASPYVKTCKSSITTVGQHKVKKIARRIAMQSWGQQAAALYGASWADLGNATVSQNGCSFQAPNWTCIYAAKPCRITDTRGITPHKPGLMPGLKPTW